MTTMFLNWLFPQSSGTIEPQWPGAKPSKRLRLAAITPNERGAARRKFQFAGNAKLVPALGADVPVTGPHPADGP